MNQNIQKAFTLAHRASEDVRFPAETRAVFRAIAHQIWLASGSQSQEVREARREIACVNCGMSRTAAETGYYGDGVGCCELEYRCGQCGRVLSPVREGVWQCVNSNCEIYGRAWTWGKGDGL